MTRSIWRIAGGIVGIITGITIAYINNKYPKKRAKCAGESYDRAFQFVKYPVYLAFAGVFFGSFVDGHENK